MLETIAHTINLFNSSLKKGIAVPDDIFVLNPMEKEDVCSITEQFYRKFYNDSNPRIFILGINPGRIGAGITGIPFTDVVELEKMNIENTFNQKSELSASFIYEAIHAFGSIESFYSAFYITSVCTLGFIQGGRNINYYDNNELLLAVEQFIYEKLKYQTDNIPHSDKCICIGQGKNFNYLNNLNKKYHFFKKIHVLPHPRWIMQYQQKKKAEYLQEYVALFNKLLK